MASSQWLDWAREAQKALSLQQRSHWPAAKALLAQAQGITEPLPTSFPIIYDGTAHSHTEDALPERGNALEMLLLTGGGLGPFRLTHPRSLAPGERPEDARDTLFELGKFLISSGAPPNKDFVALALTAGLGTINTPGYLAACEAWGALDVMDAQRALGACGRHGGWNTEGGALAREWLIKHGALIGGKDWSSCEKQSQPLVGALQARDFKAFKELAKAKAKTQAGGGMDWRDPATGATLWHFIAVGGPAMAKAIAPLLASGAPGLSDLPTVMPEDFGEPGWAIHPGQRPLHCASKELNLPLATLLLDLGADPNALDAKGNTALHALARRHGAKAEISAKALVELLLSRGADPGISNLAGKSPAQAMAAAAPLSALRPLLDLRPMDIAGQDPEQKAALKALASREGREALSLAEQVVLSAQGAQAPTSTQLTRKPRL